MKAPIILDSLIERSNGISFHFDDRFCSLSLLKEAIFRGFQVQNQNPLFNSFFPSYEEDGNGEEGGHGDGHGKVALHGFYFGRGESWGWGFSRGSWNDVSRYFLPERERASPLSGSEEPHITFRNRWGHGIATGYGQVGNGDSNVPFMKEVYYLL